LPLTVAFLFVSYVKKLNKFAFYAGGEVIESTSIFFSGGLGLIFDTKKLASFS